MKKLGVFLILVFTLFGCGPASDDLDEMTVRQNVRDPAHVAYFRNADTFSNIAIVCPDENHAIYVTSSDYMPMLYLPYCPLVEDRSDEMPGPIMGTTRGVEGPAENESEGLE